MGLKAVILGVGRARPWCLGSLPMELAPLVNRPLALRQLDTLRRAGVRQVAVVADQMVGAKLQRVIASAGGAPLDLSYIVVPREASPAERLLVAEPFLYPDASFVVQAGDALVEHDVRRSLSLLDSRGLHAVAVDPRGRRTARRTAQLRALRAAGVPHLGFSPPLLVADADIFPAIRDGGGDLDLAQALLALGERVGGVETAAVTGWVEEIESVEDLLAANRRMLDRLEPDRHSGIVHESNVLGPVSIGPHARVENSLVRGPVAIAADVLVSDAYVGPHTCIGAAAVIERVEMESCVILPGAFLENLPARLEGSVIGENARVFGGSGLPRALHISVGADARLSLT